MLPCKIQALQLVCDAPSVENATCLCPRVSSHWPLAPLRVLAERHDATGERGKRGKGRLAPISRPRRRRQTGLVSVGRSDAIMMARSEGGVSRGREERGGQIASLMKRNDGNANNTAADDGDHGRGDAAPSGDL